MTLGEVPKVIALALKRHHTLGGFQDRKPLRVIAKLHLIGNLPCASLLLFLRCLYFYRGLLILCFGFIHVLLLLLIGVTILLEHIIIAVETFQLLPAAACDLKHI